MKKNRREFLRKGGATIVASFAGGSLTGAPRKPSEASALHGKRLGSMFNCDINGLLFSTTGGSTTAKEFRQAVDRILDNKPGMLAYNVGLPDPVTYRSTVATLFHKHLVEVGLQTWADVWGPLDKAPKEQVRESHQRQADAMNRFLEAGTDPLTLTIEAGRRRGIAIVASYRMNAEDWYQNTWRLSDFGRAHPDWRIPKAGCLDPAIPGVFEQRMKIFTEVAGKFDIDGIEFDFRRWYHMVSNPLVNYPVLTRMVRETRKMLDETARRKGREKLILGARVGPSLNTDPNPFVFPGSSFPKKPEDASCKDLGLDVKTWIAEGLVDYLCPALFGAALPGCPKTREFSALAKDTSVGIYPTLWSLAPWQNKWPNEPISLENKDEKALAVYKDELCSIVLRMYEDGADGISTFNWGGAGPGADAVQAYIYPIMGSPAEVRRYRDEPWATPPKV